MTSTDNRPTQADRDRLADEITAARELLASLPAMGSAEPVDYPRLVGRLEITLASLADAAEVVAARTDKP